MKYREKVINYFGFTLGMEINSERKKKKAIYITGTVNRKIIKFYIVAIIFISIVTFIGANFSKAIFHRNSLLLINFIMNVIIPILTAVMILIKSKLLYKKLEPKKKNINIYQRELPSKLKPAHVRMLLTDGVIDSTTIAGTLLDLIDNGYIELSKNRTKLDIWRNQEIILTKTNKNQDKLFKYEQFLINWFINECGKDGKVSNTQIKEALSKVSDLNKPNEKFEQFQALVMISFPLNKFYNSNKENISKKRNIFLVTLLFIAAAFMPFYLGPFLFTYALGKIIFTTPKYILNQNGVDEKDSWLDLKKYLLDFSHIQEKTVEMIAVWEFYLTYSIVLDIDSKARLEMENFFGDEIYNSLVYRESSKEELSDLISVRETLRKREEEIKKDNVEIEKDIKKELEKYK